MTAGVDTSEKAWADAWTEEEGEYVKQNIPRIPSDRIEKDRNFSCIVLEGEVFNLFNWFVVTIRGR